MGRLTIHDGSDAQQADVTGIKRHVHNLTTKVDDTTGTALVKATVIFDALQETGGSGDRWDADATGYNLLDVVPIATWTTAGRYLIEYIVTPVSGEAFCALQVEVTVKEVRAT